jgi:hypothetical protein
MEKDGRLSIARGLHLGSAAAAETTGSGAKRYWEESYIGVERWC